MKKEECWNCKGKGYPKLMATWCGDPVEIERTCFLCKGKGYVMLEPIKPIDPWSSSSFRKNDPWRKNCIEVKNVR